MTDRPAALAENNPLDKVPVVILDDGRRLYDLPVICEYLDSLHDGPKLIPEISENRWEVLRLQALGDGVSDAAVLYGGEMRRPEAFRFEPLSSAPRIHGEISKLGIDVSQATVTRYIGRRAPSSVRAARGLNTAGFRLRVIV